MVNIPGKIIVDQTLMQSILLYLQDKPYREVANLIAEIISLNEQKQTPEEEKSKEN